MLEALKVPARWEHRRHSVTFVRSYDYLHDVRAEVEDEGMEARAQTY